MYLKVTKHITQSAFPTDNRQNTYAGVLMAKETVLIHLVRHCGF